MATWDAFALATAIAARDAPIELCVGPLATAVRDPMAMAMGVASVAAVARRPVHLAIGSSSQVVGRALARARARAHRAPHPRDGRGAAAVARRGEGAVRGGAGAHRRLPAAASCSDDLPDVAAFGEATVRVAARVADRMVLNLVTPELVSRMAERLRRRQTR